MYREERRLGWKGWGLLAGSFVQGQDLVTYYEAAEALQHHETAGPIIRRAIETEFGHGSVELGYLFHGLLVKAPLVPLNAHVLLPVGGMWDRDGQLVVRVLLPIPGPATGGACRSLDVPASELWPFTQEQRVLARSSRHFFSPSDLAWAVALESRGCPLLKPTAQAGSRTAKAKVSLLRALRQLHGVVVKQGQADRLAQRLQELEDVWQHTRREMEVRAAAMDDLFALEQQMEEVRGELREVQYDEKDLAFAEGLVVRASREFEQALLDAQAVEQSVRARSGNGGGGERMGPGAEGGTGAAWRARNEPYEEGVGVGRDGGVEVKQEPAEGQRSGKRRRSEGGGRGWAQGAGQDGAGPGEGSGASGGVGSNGAAQGASGGPGGGGSGEGGRWVQSGYDALAGKQVLCEVPAGSPAEGVVKTLARMGVPVAAPLMGALQALGAREPPPELRAHVEGLVARVNRGAAMQALKRQDYEGALKMLGALKGFSANQAQYVAAMVEKMTIEFDFMAEQGPDGQPMDEPRQKRVDHLKKLSESVKQTMQMLGEEVPDGGVIRHTSVALLMAIAEHQNEKQQQQQQQQQCDSMQGSQGQEHQKQQGQQQQGQQQGQSSHHQGSAHQPAGPNSSPPGAALHATQQPLPSPAHTHTNTHTHAPAPHVASPAHCSGSTSAAAAPSPAHGSYSRAAAAQPSPSAHAASNTTTPGGLHTPAAAASAGAAAAAAVHTPSRAVPSASYAQSAQSAQSPKPAPHTRSEAQAPPQGAQAAQQEAFFYGYVILKDHPGPRRRSLGGSGPGLEPSGAADTSGADTGTKAAREKLKGAFVKTAPLNLGALGLDEQQQQQQQQPLLGYSFLTLPDRRIYFTPDQPGQALPLEEWHRRLSKATLVREVGVLRFEDPAAMARLHTFMERHGWRGPSERGRTVRVGESCWRAPAPPPYGATHHVQLTVNVVGGDSWWAAERLLPQLPNANWRNALRSGTAVLLLLWVNLVPGTLSQRQGLQRQPLPPPLPDVVQLQAWQGIEQQQQQAAAAAQALPPARDLEQERQQLQQQLLHEAAQPGQPADTLMREHAPQPSPQHGHQQEQQEQALLSPQESQELEQGQVQGQAPPLQQGLQEQVSPLLQQEPLDPEDAQQQEQLRPPRQGPAEEEQGQHLGPMDPGGWQQQEEEGPEHGRQQEQEETEQGHKQGQHKQVSPPPQLELQEQEEGQQQEQASSAQPEQQEKQEQDKQHEQVPRQHQEAQQEQEEGQQQEQVSLPPPQQEQAQAALSLQPPQQQHPGPPLVQGQQDVQPQEPLQEFPQASVVQQELPVPQQPESLCTEPATQELPPPNPQRPEHAEEHDQGQQGLSATDDLASANTAGVSKPAGEGPAAAVIPASAVAVPSAAAAEATATSTAAAAAVSEAATPKGDVATMAAPAASTATVPAVVPAEDDGDGEPMDIEEARAPVLPHGRRSPQATAGASQLHMAPGAGPVPGPLPGPVPAVAPGSELLLHMPAGPGLGAAGWSQGPQAAGLSSGGVPACAQPPGQYQAPLWPPPPQQWQQQAAPPAPHPAVVPQASQPLQAYAQQPTLPQAVQQQIHVQPAGHVPPPAGPPGQPSWAPGQMPLQHAQQQQQQQLQQLPHHVPPPQQHPLQHMQHPHQQQPHHVQQQQWPPQQPPHHLEQQQPVPYLVQQPPQQLPPHHLQPQQPQQPIQIQQQYLPPHHLQPQQPHPSHHMQLQQQLLPPHNVQQQPQQPPPYHVPHPQHPPPQQQLVPAPQHPQQHSAPYHMQQQQQQQQQPLLLHPDAPPQPHQQLGPSVQLPAQHLAPPQLQYQAPQPFPTGQHHPHMHQLQHQHPAGPPSEPLPLYAPSTAPPGFHSPAPVRAHGMPAPHAWASPHVPSTPAQRPHQPSFQPPEPYPPPHPREPAHAPPPPATPPPPALPSGGYTW